MHPSRTVLIAALVIVNAIAAAPVYRKMKGIYAACEAHALGRGPMPVTGETALGNPART